MSRVAETRLYDVLKVKPNANENDLKKAYRKCMKDCKTKGVNERDVQFAYSVLSDPERRRAYDTLGEAAVMEDEEYTSHHHPGPHSLFSHIFGDGDPFFGFGHGGGRQRQRQRRGEDVMHVLKGTLEDMYNGKKKQLQLTKKVICSRCKGVGGKADSVKTCSACRGRGIRVIVNQIGPGMVQQMQTVCSDCQGQGEIIDDKFRCQNCNGEKVIQEKKVLEVSPLILLCCNLLLVWILVQQVCFLK
jgi:DnaJ family protein A protein 2